MRQIPGKFSVPIPFSVLYVGSGLSWVFSIFRGEGSTTKHNRGGKAGDSFSVGEFPRGIRGLVEASFADYTGSGE